MLEGFVGGGLRSSDSAIVITTPHHLQILEERLEASGLDVAATRSRDQYIPLEAEETLKSFMKNGWPDDEKFFRVVKELLARGKRNGRKVRAFDEMVAIMWARGEHGDTVRLEYLWHQLCILGRTHSERTELPGEVY